MRKHTQGSWWHGGSGCCILREEDEDDHGEILPERRIACTWVENANGVKTDTYSREDEANAARIVACVNALDGIDDPEVFVGEVAALIEVAAGLSTLIDGWGGLTAHAAEINALGAEATALLAKLPSDRRP